MITGHLLSKRSMRLINKQKPDDEPLATILTHMVQEHNIPKACFERLIAVKREDVIQTQAKKMEDLLHRSQETYVNIYVMVLKLLDIKVDISKDMDFLILMENLARTQGLIEYIKQIPFDLVNYKLRIPVDICVKHNLHIGNIWERVNGKPKEEFFDAMLE